MNKDKLREDDDMLPEYDFSKGERGKFYQGHDNWIARASLDQDVVKHFSTSEQVNEALRMLIAEGRAPKPRKK
jgi:outer membrane protein assembly factor BamD (BamD/ComL family)